MTKPTPGQDNSYDTGAAIGWIIVGMVIGALLTAVMLFHYHLTVVS